MNSFDPTTEELAEFDRWMREMSPGEVDVPIFELIEWPGRPLFSVREFVEHVHKRTTTGMYLLLNWRRLLRQ